MCSCRGLGFFHAANGRCGACWNAWIYCHFIWSLLVFVWVNTKCACVCVLLGHVGSLCTNKYALFSSLVRLFCPLQILLQTVRFSAFRPFNANYPIQTKIDTIYEELIYSCRQKAFHHRYLCRVACGNKCVCITHVLKQNVRRIMNWQSECET